MRLLLCFVLAGAAWAQQSTLTVCGAYARTRPGGEILEGAHLGAYLEVVIHKADYEALTPKPTADFFLYLDGQKSSSGAQPVVLNDIRPAERKPAGEDGCSAEVQRKADEARAVAQASRDALTRSPADQQLKDKAAADAKAVGDANANVQKIRSDPTLVFSYYLDPHVLSDKDPGNQDLRNVWLQLLQRPWEKVAVNVSVGPGAGAWPSKAAPIKFDRLSYGRLFGWAVLFVAFVVVFFIYADKSDIIRDFGPLPAGTPAGTRKSFSLARSQMALWTFLVAGAMAFLYVVTWNENTLTSGVLILIGISSGTTLLAAAAEGSPASQPTRSFLTDLLSDGTPVPNSNDKLTGVSFHRFQMVFFTLILAVIFIAKVAYDLVMPDFDPTLLGLIGISGGTYIGFKLKGE